MTRTRTVLFLHSGRDWVRGSERVLLDLTANLPPDRYRPVVWCDAPALRRACEQVGVPCVSAPLPESRNRPWWRVPPQAVRLAGAVLPEVRADLIHVNMLECLPWAIHIARRARLPVVAHLHLPTSLEDRVWSGLHQATVVVGVSRSSLAWVAGDGFPPSAARVIYNGVVPARLERGDATRLRGQLGIPAGALVAVIVGSLIPRKAIHIALAALKQEAGNVHLIIVGDGEERSRLEAQVRAAGTTARVHFLGDRDDAGAILRDAADVLVSAATAETLGLNVIEAGYFGLPAVVSDIPPHREILEPGRSGLVFPSGDSEELSRQLRLLERDPALRRRLGSAAREAVRRRFLADRMCAEFLSLYDELTSRNRWHYGWVGGSRLPSSYVRLALNRIFRSSAPLGTRSDSS